VSQNTEYSFAQQIRFSAEFSAANPITKITLLFAVQADWRVFEAELPVVQQNRLASVSYLLDLQKHPIHPFARVDYWWYVETKDGTSLETDPVSFLYADNRYDWHSATQGGTAVYWAADDPALGHTALRIAQDGLERIQTILPGSLEQEITIYIYPSLDELGSAMRLANLDWVDGIASPELGVILLSASDGPAAVADLRRTIPHEVAHFAIDQAAGGRNNQVPFWLHEGLASNNTDHPDPTFALALEEAIVSESLFSLRTLCAPPLADQSSALLFYAQSASVVRYLQNLYGNHTLRDLVAAYGDGADCNGGVERVLGISLNKLDTEWQAHLKDGEEESGDNRASLDNLIVWLGLLTGTAALASALFLFRPRLTESEIEYDQSS
jgi:hypothetical protein